MSTLSVILVLITAILWIVMRLTINKPWINFVLPIIIFLVAVVALAGFIPEGVKQEYLYPLLGGFFMGEFFKKLLNDLKEKLSGNKKVNKKSKSESKNNKKEDVVEEDYDEDLEEEEEEEIIVMSDEDMQDRPRIVRQTERKRKIDIED